MKPFMIQTVRNGCPTLENDLGKTSDNFWAMKTSLPDAQTRYRVLSRDDGTGHLESVPESDHNLPPEKHFVLPTHAV